jgi:hypothetical protein
MAATKASELGVNLTYFFGQEYLLPGLTKTLTQLILYKQNS